MTCELCNDVGFVTREDRNVMCRCRIIAGIRASIGQYPELKGITLKEGLVVDHRDPIQGSKIIRSKWDEFRQHLLGWMWAAHLRGRCPKLLITTDIDLRSRWLGQGEHSSESHSTLSSLREFDLVVVQIKRVKHKATPQALLEASSYAPQMWFVHEPNDTVSPKHSSWSDDLEELFGETRLDLASEEGTPKASETSVTDLLGIKEVNHA